MYVPTLMYITFFHQKLWRGNHFSIIPPKIVLIKSSQTLQIFLKMCLEGIYKTLLFLMNVDDFFLLLNCGFWYWFANCACLLFHC